MRVLLIDDNEEIGDVLSFYFDETGINYKIVNNGRDGLHMIQTEDFDLILLDIAMPEFSGLDIIDSLKKDGLLESKNVVVMTASSHMATLERIADSGVKEIFKKPCSLDDLKDLIEKYRKD